VRPPLRARRPAARAALVLLLAAWALAPAPARADETVPVQVLVDGRPRGEVTVRLTDAGDVLIPRGALENLGVAGVPPSRGRVFGGERYVGLNALFPRVTWRLDHAGGVLYLTLRAGPAPEPPRLRPGRKALETVIMAVTFNAAPVGDRIFHRNLVGVPLLALEDLEALGLTGMEAVARDIQGRPFVALDALRPWLRYTVDEKAGRLDITVDPERLKPTRVDLGSYPAPGAERLDAPAAFVNYAVGYTAGEGGTFTALDAPVEVGVRARGAFLSGTFLYTKRDADGTERLVRQDLRLTRDDEADLRRYRVGDLTTAVEPLGGQVRMGGVSVSRAFDIAPYFVRYPGLSVAGTLDTPSEVEVYVDGALVRRDRLPAGEFTYANLPRAIGAGHTELVIRDAFGRERRIDTPFYVSPRVLKPGLSSYSYDLGVKRESYGTRDFAYGGPVVSAFHRVGLTRGITLGYRAEADRDRVSGGPSAALVLGRAGEADLALAASGADLGAGAAWQAGYGYAGRTVGLRLSAAGMSAHYATLSLDPDAERARLDLRGSVGLTLRRFGSLSVARTLARHRPGPSLARTSLFYSRPLALGASLFLRASRTRHATLEDEVFAGLTVALGGDRSASVDRSSREDLATTRAAVRKNAPLGPGWGYRLEGTRRDTAGGDTADDGDAYAEYHGPWGIYQAEARAGPATETYRLAAAGAVAWTGDTVRPARPVRDGFAVVRVPGVKGVKVYYANRLAARTDSGGVAVVPHLLSYLDNRLSIDDTDVPIGYRIDAVSRTVTVPYRGAGTVTFPVARLQAVVGRVFVRERGRAVPAEFGRLAVTVGEREVAGPIGRGGEFYLENLGPGTHPARVTWKDAECRFTIRVPESDDVMIDVGQVTCGGR